MEVKRLEPETILWEAATGGFGLKTPNHITYGVTENGKVVKDGRGNFMIFKRKSSAQKEADHLMVKANAL